ncbi:hypothetical protein Q1695_009075 [Nippostrongylus brasiliensis]|nr:hypothetical protein Q1695_009075 [Nippostrongylus brasiliensis]
MDARKPFVVFFSFGVLVWIYLFITMAGNDSHMSASNADVDGDSAALAALSEQAKQDEVEIMRLRAVISRLSISNPRAEPESEAVGHQKKRRKWEDPIPVLVFACNRADAVSSLLRKLIELRPSKELFPIIVSQDCNDEKVRSAVNQFLGDVQYVKHQSAEEAQVDVPFHHTQYATYYYIARHYKLALEHVFDKLGYNSVILLEDDLDISTDFFEYFSGTRYLLDLDPMLWCVSAWNDNGKAGNIDRNAHSLLYRSDFFPGLGWMMTRTLWKEVGPKWPAGFWDDWLREPENRKDRQCIRPEISRTKMTSFGKLGASKGLFFNKHLARVILNDVYVAFTSMDLDYLLNPKYDGDFNRTVFQESPLMSVEDAVRFTLHNGNAGRSIRVEYNGNEDYIRKADTFHVMHDFKAGVPRTAYQGVVTCFFNGVRVFLVPDRNVVKNYIKSWEVPERFERN